MESATIKGSVSTANVTDDREACSKFWIAAYTRPRSEKKAQSELNKVGIETYVPIQRQLRQWSDRKKMVDVVVIPMVIFLRINNEDMKSISSHPFIIKPITLPGEKRAAHIPTKQIDLLKYILGQSEIPVAFDSSIPQVYDTVRIARGKLMGVLGEVISVSESNMQLVIKIDLLGGARLTVPQKDIELLSR